MSISISMFKERVSKMEEIMRSYKLPITPQKRAIFEALAKTDKHPTAEQVHRTVKEQFPNLSFATVYKNLRKFLDLGLAQEIKTNRGVSHFDADVSTHGHVVNLKTKEMFDVELDGPFPYPKGVERDQITHIGIVYYINA